MNGNARKHANGKAQPNAPVRCAIYTRKSTDEKLDLNFNSLDAQRESGEAYIASQKALGWVCLAQRYDDGGYTGANVERPALQRLLEEVEAGRIDCVVVYKVDRLSRSLLDFSRLMATFEQHGVAFVSVTQQFNTSHSMGRLTLNILLSFAQFEREIISERTRDKIAAARRKGLWSGGHPMLGYDVATEPGGRKLVVNEAEAQRVRAIFELYRSHKRLLPVLRELERRGWHSKAWITRQSKRCGGRPFDKVLLLRLLTNPIYIGQVRHRDQRYPGRHAAIVDESVWEEVQALLREHGRRGRATVKGGALLNGLVRCVPCAAPMGHTYSTRGNRRYRYYVCRHAQQRGWNACPSKSVPAGALEDFVLAQLRSVAPGAHLLPETWDELPLSERARLIHEGIERIDYDGRRRSVAITFRAHAATEEAAHA